MRADRKSGISALRSSSQKPDVKRGYIQNQKHRFLGEEKTHTPHRARDEVPSESRATLRWETVIGLDNGALKGENARLRRH